MKWNNYLSVNTGARYKSLYPDTEIYTLNSSNEALIDATEDFSVYYETTNSSYTIALTRIDTDGNGIFKFYISADGVNYTPIKQTDGTTDLTFSYSTADTDNIVFNRVDKGYVKITHENTDNTEGSIIVKIKMD